MTRIIIVPLEPLSERYTEQWYRRFPPTFALAGYDVVQIDGVPLLNDEIKVGAFLDINSTTHYKWSQLQQISKMFHEGQVADGTIFFFADIEFWGIEAIRLLADMNGIKIKMTGFLHAGSYTNEDAFAIAAPYQRYTEVGWVAAMDKVFVGSEYHKTAFISRRLAPLNAYQLVDSIKVTKNPVFLDEYPYFGHVPKQKRILLTNRFDREKRPGETLRLFAELKASHPEWQFIICTGRPTLRGHPDDVALAETLNAEGVIQIKAGLTKNQYHSELAEAYMMVSHSIEENYGYCLAEAIIYDCIPLVRDGLSHNEFVGPEYRFTTNDYARAVHWMDKFGQPLPSIHFDDQGMQNILNEIETL